MEADFELLNFSQRHEHPLSEPSSSVLWHEITEVSISSVRLTDRWGVVPMSHIREQWTIDGSTYLTVRMLYRPRHDFR